MTDPLETLALADPARELAPSLSEAARMDATFRAMVAAEEARVGAAREPRVKKGRGARWLLAPVALAAVLAGVMLAAPENSPKVLPQPEPASAATVLTELSHKVAQAPAEQGRYAYLKQLMYITHMRGGGSEGPYAVVMPHEYEQWVDGNGEAIVRETVHEDQATFPTPEDKQRFDQEPPQPSPYDESPRRTDDLTIAQLTYAQVQSLPTDPVQLRARLEDTNVAVTARVGQLLSSAATPTKVKVALFEVLKSLPGAHLLSDVKDPLGRAGVAIEFDDPAWRSMFLFDPKDGAVLGSRSIGHKELPGRDITDWSLTVKSERTDAAPTTAR